MINDDICYQVTGGEKYVDADPKRTNLKYTDSGMRTVFLRH